MAKDLLKISDWTKEEVLALFEKTHELKKILREGKVYEPLKGKNLAMIFHKASTRTRVSFEVGMTQLGGHAIFLDSSATQIGRGEPICDTARVLSRYVDCVMIRTYNQADVEEFSMFADVPIINGLTDMYHPCQVLCDIFTVKEKRENYRDLKYAFIGDGNNMAHSWINAALVLGLNLSIATPEEYGPDPELVNKAKEESNGKIVITNDPLEAAGGADVINTDVWVSMGQEEEEKDKLGCFKGFQINGEMMKFASDDAILLHCLPVHRGEEVTEEVIEGKNSAIFDQAENRLHIQKGILLSMI
jgi:ornithine carbamoyltransferase